jgi:hypothetical protein
LQKCFKWHHSWLCLTHICIPIKNILFYEVLLCFTLINSYNISSFLQGSMHTHWAYKKECWGARLIVHYLTCILTQAIVLSLVFELKRGKTKKFKPTRDTKKTILNLDFSWYLELPLWLPYCVPGWG